MLRSTEICDSLRHDSFITGNNDNFGAFGDKCFGTSKAEAARTTSDNENAFCDCKIHGSIVPRYVTDV